MVSSDESCQSISTSATNLLMEIMTANDTDINQVIEFPVAYIKVTNLS